MYTFILYFHNKFVFNVFNKYYFQLLVDNIVYLAAIDDKILNSIADNEKSIKRQLEEYTHYRKENKLKFQNNYIILSGLNEWYYELYEILIVKIS